MVRHGAQQGNSSVGCWAGGVQAAESSTNARKEISGGVGSAKQPQVALPFCCLPAGRDLHAALDVRAASTGKRVFGWYARGRRVAHEIARAIGYLHSMVRAVGACIDAFGF